MKKKESPQKQLFKRNALFGILAGMLVVFIAKNKPEAIILIVIGLVLGYLYGSKYWLK